MYEFQHLARPINIGQFTYRNRIIAAPLGKGRFASDGGIIPRTRDLLEARAKGGCAEVCVGETPVDFIQANREDEPTTLYRDMERAPSFRAFTQYSRAIKKYGAVALIELSHAGNARARLPGALNPTGPIDYIRADGVRVDGMDKAKMDEVTENFVIAAEFMKRAGFDGVMIHAGHGWLLNQFLSARTNTRQDEFGGCLQNRAKFPIEILRAVREHCGRDFLIEVRVSGSEKTEGGMEVDEVAEFCGMLDGIADLIHVSVGLYHDPVLSMEFSTMFQPKGCNAHYSEIIKKVTNLPVAVVGGINDPAFADKLIADGKTDIVALGRALTADPEWANKALNGQSDDIAKCLRCLNCFPGPKEDVLEEYKGKMPALKCTINPLNDPGIPLENSNTPKSVKKVLVIGGGVAGMEAAIVAADRGHMVTLVEKSDRLGGLLNFSDRDLYKTDLHEFKELMKRRVIAHNIHVLLNTEGTPELIKKENADVVIIAVGSEPVVLPIRGIENAMQALDTYSKDLGVIDQNVIIVGGGLVGCETGLNLAKMGKKITVVEMSNHIASDSNNMHRIGLLDEMKKHLTIMTGLKCTEIMKNGIVAEDGNGEKHTFKCDTVVYALGMKAKNCLASELKAACNKAQVFIIGDCDKANKVVKAVEDGFVAAMRII